MNIKFSSTTTSTIVINPVNIFTDGSSKEFNKKADKASMILFSKILIPGKENMRKLRV